MTSPLWFRDSPNLEMYLNIQFNTLKKKLTTKCDSCFMHPDCMDMAQTNYLPIFYHGFGAAFLIPKNQPFHYVDPKQYQIFEPQPYTPKTVTEHHGINQWPFPVGNPSCCTFPVFQEGVLFQPRVGRWLRTQCSCTIQEIKSKKQ